MLLQITDFYQYQFKLKKKKIKNNSPSKYNKKYKIKNKPFVFLPREICVKFLI